MDRLQIQLIVRLDRNEAHVLAFHRLGDRLRVDEVVLVRLHEGLHKLGRNQPDIVPLLAQRTAEEVSAGARLQADQRGLHVRGVSQQLLLRELLPHKYLARCAKRYKMKVVLPRSMPTECICMSMILLHRNYHHDPPANPGESKRRTISLTLWMKDGAAIALLPG